MKKFTISSLYYRCNNTFIKYSCMFYFTWSNYFLLYDF